MVISEYDKRLRAVAILTMAGSPFYALCFLGHVCMDGHMQHGPYGPLAWIVDLCWSVSFVAVTVFSATVRAKRRALFAFGGVMLVLSRILLGSGGGGNALIELPVLIAMNVYAFEYLANPKIFLWPAQTIDCLPQPQAAKTRPFLCFIGLMVLAAVVVWQYLRF